jgi:uncharacterized membrane protein
VDQTTQFIAMVIAALIGMLAVLAILRRERHTREDATRESPFATSTEGMKRCRSCGNLVTDSNCLNCGKRLPG